MIWPFRRKKRPTGQLPPINEDWRVGDLAACIMDGGWTGGIGPTYGSIHRVTAVVEGHLKKTNEPVWGLQLQPWLAYYHAEAFRKVRPDAEECSTEFKALIGLVLRKPAKTGVDA